MYAARHLQQFSVACGAVCYKTGAGLVCPPGAASPGTQPELKVSHYVKNVFSLCCCLDGYDLQREFM